MFCKISIFIKLYVKFGTNLKNRNFGYIKYSRKYKIISIFKTHIIVN